MLAAPIVSIVKKSFTATGNYNPYLDVDGTTAIPFQFIPSKWALQVTGVDANDAMATPTAWNVLVLGSVDGIAFTSTAAIAQHSSLIATPNANGDVVYPVGPGGFGGMSATFMPVRYIRVNVATLTLGATATKIYVSVWGI